MKKIILLVPFLAFTFFANNSCSSKLPWYLDTKYLNNLQAIDVNRNGGVTQTLIINGQSHKVRLIGVDHDDLADGSGKAHTTWEFENYISDANGYSLATFWENGSGDYSYANDFPNSGLRKALDGQGPGKITWYEKGASTHSNIYKTSILDMLPNNLKSVLKEVKKDVAICTATRSFVLDSYNTKLFPLSYYEMTRKTPPDILKEGNTYVYYGAMGSDIDLSRLKHQIKWHNGAATTSTKIADVTYEESTAENFAGFNSTREYFGGYSWLRTPHTNFDAASAYQLSVAGSFLSYSVYGYALAIAPAFCL